MKKIITVILLLMMFITGYAQRIVVYKQLDESLIKVSASSELNKGTICSVVNGDGMQGCYHVANNLGHGMWLSEVSKKPVRYNKSTHEGVVWFLCDFGKSRKCPEVDLIQDYVLPIQELNNIPNHHSLVIAIYSHPLSTLYIPY